MTAKTMASKILRYEPSKGQLMKTEDAVALRLLEDDGKVD